MSFRCPHCDVKLVPEHDLEGRIVFCPVCKQDFKQITSVLNPFNVFSVPRVWIKSLLVSWGLFIVSFIVSVIGCKYLSVITSNVIKLEEPSLLVSIFIVWLGLITTITFVITCVVLVVFF